MNFSESIKSVFSKYATFSGRACRSEYWNFVFFNLVVTCVLYFADKAIFPEMGESIYSPKAHILQNIYSLAVFLPGLAVVVRRLHDIGKSGLSVLSLMLSVLIIALIGLLVSIATDVNPTLFVIFLYLVLFTILIVEIIFIVWMCRDSEPGANKWGPNPKGQTEALPTTRLADSTKDDTSKVYEDMLVIDDFVYQFDSHLVFRGHEGLCRLDAIEPIVDGVEPTYFFHADIEKRTFNTTINFPGCEWIFCHFRFKSRDLEFGPENFTSGKISIGKDDLGVSFKGDGKLDTGQMVSFYIYIPTENYSYK